MSALRILFMGTPAYAVPALERLTRLGEVVAVYTNPDAASRRGRATYPSPVRVCAESLGLPIATPTTLRDPGVVADVRALAPDVIIVAAYGKLLPPAVLVIPPCGCLNLHASLLPRWRGAAPIQRALLAGDEQTGVSLMRMEEGLDTGPYAAQTARALGEKTADELTAELAHAGADLLEEHWPAVCARSLSWHEQDAAAATYADKLTKADVALGPTIACADLLRRVRASSDSAPARLHIGAHGVRILSAQLSAPGSGALEPVPAGTIRVTRRGLFLGASDGALEVLRMKPDGKQEMDAAAFARGSRLETGSSWSN